MKSQKIKLAIGSALLAASMLASGQMVLCLVAEGLSNREIGQRLVISSGTVKAHVSNMYAKLDVRKRTQAVAKARVLGILPST